MLVCSITTGVNGIHNNNTLLLCRGQPSYLLLYLEPVVGHKPVRTTFVHGMCFNYFALSICVAFASGAFSSSGCA